MTPEKAKNVKKEPGTAAPQRTADTWDDLYAFENAVFEVEKKKFKVPKKLLFDASASPENMFTFKPADQENPEGVYVAEGVSKSDFRALLEVLYPLPFATASAVPNSSAEHWLAVLRISTKWNMEAPKTKAAAQITESKDLTSIQKLVIGRDYKLVGLQQKAYMELIEREQGLTDEEANILAKDSAIRVYWAREQKYPRHQRRRRSFDMRWEDGSARWDGEISDGLATMSGSFEFVKGMTSASNIVLQQFSKELGKAKGKGTGNVDLIDIVIKAEQVGVKRWLQEAYEAVVLREKAITPKEAQNLSMQTTMRLCAAREQLSRGDEGMYSLISAKNTLRCFQEAWALEAAGLKRKAAAPLEAPAREVGPPGQR